MGKAGTGKETPLMQQYNSVKAQYPGTILLFRVGDFYETFSEDAIVASKVLGIVLTKRANGAASEIELAGFPHHSLDAYLPKLVKAGYRVAVCDQLEDPKLTKSIVKRGVTEIVSPGVALNDKLLDHRANNFLACLYTQQDMGGLALVDISTGEFMATTDKLSRLDKLMQTYAPAEVLVPKSKLKEMEAKWNRLKFSPVEDWFFSLDYVYPVLTRHFKTSSMKGFGLEEQPEALITAGVALHYLQEARHPDLSHINQLSRIEPDRYVWLDRFTLRNLELVDGQSEGAVSLLEVVDRTQTPMGARMLRNWLLFPLKDQQEIEGRQNVVAFIKEKKKLREQLRQLLQPMPDLERLVAKIATGRINPRETVQFREALRILRQLKSLLNEQELPELLSWSNTLDALETVEANLTRCLKDEAPLSTSKGGILKEGVIPDLDELRQIAYSGKDYLLQIQQREASRTGITSLKVSYNNVFGYYLEVTHVHKDKVPAEWVRKQTLVNAERYITDELKHFEEKILGAEEKIVQMEENFFRGIVQELAAHIAVLQIDARLTARIDCLCGLSILALEKGYCKPEIDDSMELDIVDGRHPVLETRLPEGESYVPNSLKLDDSQQQIIMITGPNMSGKSAILRQTALIVILAQIGSHVPAKKARIGLVDKVFTRVGANDNLSGGESTFMVEMNETASILNNLSPRSLVLLDEIGRGTATYDGISIAWAVAEFLHNNPKAKARTLFATHYHELNEMEKSYPRIHNYTVSVKELPDKIIFLRKLIPGGSHHSFGIHVARMAGVPDHVVAKARLILKDLESQRGNQVKVRPVEDKLQMSLFQMDHPELLRIKEILDQTEIDNLTPVEALFRLYELKKILSPSAS